MSEMNIHSVIIGDDNITELVKRYREVDRKHTLNMGEFVDGCALHFILSIAEDYSYVQRDGDIEKMKALVTDGLAGFSEAANRQLATMSAKVEVKEETDEKQTKR